MLNILIIEPEINKCKNLVNTITNLKSLAKICVIVCSKSEAINMINNFDINIILLDLNDISNMDILDYISENNITKYYNSIMIFSNNLNVYNSLKPNKYVHSIISNANNSKIVLHYLNKMLSREGDFENDFKAKIDTELNYLGFNFSHRGTHYLRECIYHFYVFNDHRTSLSKTIYPIIAEKYNATCNTIKCDIFQATNNCYYICDSAKLDKYFLQHFYSKPKTRDVIYAVLNHIDSSFEIY